mmetsp:Transcript_105666/g.202948  ORF Transcript_105666/g.202948 Transcript_105666/m.202948 type:complete len:244 (-) Transcript_105666:632-1363(-)
MMETMPGRSAAGSASNSAQMLGTVRTSCSSRMFTPPARKALVKMSTIISQLKAPGVIITMRLATDSKVTPFLPPTSAVRTVVPKVQAQAYSTSPAIAFPGPSGSYSKPTAMDFMRAGADFTADALRLKSPRLPAVPPTLPLTTLLLFMPPGLLIGGNVLAGESGGRDFAGLRKMLAAARRLLWRRCIVPLLGKSSPASLASRNFSTALTQRSSYSCRYSKMGTAAFERSNAPGVSLPRPSMPT